MTDAERRYTGNMLNDLFRLGEAVVNQFPPLGKAEGRGSAEKRAFCEASALSLYGADCHEEPFIVDPETERHLCAGCFVKKQRGTL